MDDLRVIRGTGWFGLAGVLVLALEIPLWIVPGSPPPISDGAAHAQFLADIRVIALTRIVMDMVMYACLMVFYAGFRHLIACTRPALEWAGTLVFGAGAVWWAVSLVADSLEGAAVLDTLGGADPSAVRALVEGTLLIYNGAIAFAVTAVFMAAAGYAILASRALPRWIGWLAWISAALCVVVIPAMYAPVVDHNRFYNAAGWGPAMVANLPPLVWMLVTSLAMVRMREPHGDEPAPP
jgi:hypothetical protein